MRFVFGLILLFAALATNAQNRINVIYSWSDFNAPISNKTVTVTPLWSVVNGTTNIITGDFKRYITDTNGAGTFTISNVPVGYAYRASLNNSVTTTITNYFATNLTGTVYASSNTVVPTNYVTGLLAYSIAAADARFALKSDVPAGTLTNFSSAVTFNSITNTGDYYVYNSANPLAGFVRALDNSGLFYGLLGANSLAQVTNIANSFGFITGTAASNSFALLGSYVPNSLGAGVSTYIGGTNVNGAELAITNSNAGGWAGITAQADNGNFTTNYAGIYVNNSKFVPGAGFVGSTNDAILESAVSGNFYFDVIGGNSKIIFTSRATTNGTVTTNVFLSNAALNSLVPIQQNGVAVLTNLSAVFNNGLTGMVSTASGLTTITVGNTNSGSSTNLTAGQIATIANAVTNTATGWYLDPASTNYQGCFIKLANGEESFYTNTGAAITNLSAQQNSAVRFTQVGGTNIFWISAVYGLWQLTTSTNSDNSNYRVLMYPSPIDPSTINSSNTSYLGPKSPTAFNFFSWASYANTANLYRTNFYSGRFSGIGSQIVGVRSDMIVPPVLSTNQRGNSAVGATGISGYGDSFLTGFNTNPNTNFLTVLDSFNAFWYNRLNIAPQPLSNNGQSGYTMHYFTTNNGNFGNAMIGVLEAGLNDLRWWQTNSPNTNAWQMMINDRLQFIRLSQQQVPPPSLYIVTTIPEWLNSTNYDAFNGATANGAGQLTNAAPWGATIILTNNPHTFRDYQIAVWNANQSILCMDTNPSVMVFDFNTIPELRNYLSDGLHPNTQGQVMIGRAMASMLVDNKSRKRTMPSPYDLPATNYPSAGNAYRFDGTNFFWGN